MVHTQELAPIPIPVKRHFHEFRGRYLPLVTFTFLITAICWMWAKYIGQVAIAHETNALIVNVMSIPPGVQANQVNPQMRRKPSRPATHSQVLTLNER